MRGDERPVVTNKSLGRRDVKTALVINDSPRRIFSSGLTVPAVIYHEGYVGEKKFVVPDSNLDAMATLVNLKMRRRISIRYKHQTSFDIADDDSIMQKLNRLAKKFDSMYMSSDEDDGSEGFDHWKMSVSKENEKDREDEESLSELQVEVVRSYGHLNNNYGWSQGNASKKKMSTSHLFEEVPGRSENKGMEVTSQNSTVSQTKQPEGLDNRGLAKGKVYYDSIWTSPSIHENKAADYNTISFDNCNDRLLKKCENKETGSIVEKFSSNTNQSRLLRANADGKIYSITSQHSKVPSNPLGISRGTVIMHKDSDSTKENKLNDSMLKKCVSDTSPTEISQVIKDDNKYFISSKNGKAYFDRLEIPQAKVNKMSDSRLIPENKMRGAYYSQQLTPLNKIKGVDSTNHKNAVACRNSSIGQNKNVHCKHAESRDCNSSQIFQSRTNKCIDYISRKDKGLNHDIQNLSKQQTWTKQNIEPINIELDVEADDSYNGRIYNLVNMQRARPCLQSNCLREGGDFSLKRQVVCIEVMAEDSCRGILKV